MKLSIATILNRLIPGERALLAAFSATLGERCQDADADLTQADVDAVAAELIRADDNPEPQPALVAELFGVARHDPQAFERAADQLKVIAKAAGLRCPERLYLDPQQ